MSKKEEIKKNPWRVLITARRFYSKSNLYIEVEIKDQERNLFLLKQGMCIGKGKKFHNYDEKGRHFFNDLIPIFDKVWILIPGETEKIPFDNYEKFLDKITSN